MNEAEKRAYLVRLVESVTKPVGDVGSAVFALEIKTQEVASLPLWDYDDDLVDCSDDFYWETCAALALGLVCLGYTSLWSVSFRKGENLYGVEQLGGKAIWSASSKKEAVEITLEHYAIPRNLLSAVKEVKIPKRRRAAA